MPSSPPCPWDPVSSWCIIYTAAGSGTLSHIHTGHKTSPPLLPSLTPCLSNLAPTPPQHSFYQLHTPYLSARTGRASPPPSFLGQHSKAGTSKVCFPSSPSVCLPLSHKPHRENTRSEKCFRVALDQDVRRNVPERSRKKPVAVERVIDASSSSDARW